MLQSVHTVLYENVQGVKHDWEIHNKVITYQMFYFSLQSFNSFQIYR